jgi:hypothetical protein
LRPISSNLPHLRARLWARSSWTGAGSGRSFQCEFRVRPSESGRAHNHGHRDSGMRRGATWCDSDPFRSRLPAIANSGRATAGIRLQSGYAGRCRSWAGTGSPFLANQSVALDRAALTWAFAGSLTI